MHQGHHHWTLLGTETNAKMYLASPETNDVYAVPSLLVRNQKFSLSSARAIWADVGHAQKWSRPICCIVVANQSCVLEVGSAGSFYIGN